MHLSFTGKTVFLVFFLCVFSFNTLASTNTPPANWIAAITDVGAARAVAYFRDDSLGVLHVIRGATAGETWSFETLPPNPDGTPAGVGAVASQFPGISYDGKCFLDANMTPLPSGCATRNMNMIWFNYIQCQRTGTWTFRLKHNGVVFKTAYVDLLPKVNEVAALQKFYEYQANYPNDKYGSICLPKIGNHPQKCGTSKATSIPYTIKTKGCSISSLAMVKRYHSNNPASVSAITVNNALRGKVKGFQPNGDVNWAMASDGVLNYPGWAVEKATWKSPNDARLLRSLCEDGPTIVPVNKFQHFVVVTGFDKVKGWEILDPGHINNHSLNMYGGIYNGIRLIKGSKSRSLPAVTAKDYISISIYSPAELLLIDPLGNKVGFDPATGQRVETIPNSAYWIHGQYNPDPVYIDPDPAKTMMFNHAIAGVYRLEVIGTGTGTYDLDFEMTDINGNLLLTKGVLNVSVTPSTVHTYTFNYSSAPGSIITIQGGPPPAGAVNAPPVANAGSNQTMACVAGFANVTLNGAGSSDPNGDPLTYSWSGSSFGMTTGLKPVVNLPLGTHIITLTVNDGKGGTATATTQVTVQDTTPPMVSAGLNVTIPATSANGAPFKLRPTVSDVCCTVNVVVTPQLAIYPVGMTAITATATDCAGNTASSVMQLTVQPFVPPNPPAPTPNSGHGGGQPGTIISPPSPNVGHGEVEQHDAVEEDDKQEDTDEGHARKAIDKDEHHGDDQDTEG